MGLPFPWLLNAAITGSANSVVSDGLFCSITLVGFVAMMRLDKHSIFSSGLISTSGNVSQYSLDHIHDCKVILLKIHLVTYNAARSTDINLGEQLENDQSPWFCIFSPLRMLCCHFNITVEEGDSLFPLVCQFNKFCAKCKSFSDKTYATSLTDI